MGEQACSDCSLLCLFLAPENQAETISSDSVKFEMRAEAGGK